MPIRFAIAGFVLATLTLTLAVPAAADDNAYATPDAVVAELYDLVTFDAGVTPDWDRARGLFIKEAVVVLRTSRTETAVFSVDGWVQDFIDFIEKAQVEKTGFIERIVRTKPMVFGDIAHILVLYEAEIPGWGRDPQKGVDSFQLIRKDGRWWIASIVNEIPTPERPLPAELSE